MNFTFINNVHPTFPLFLNITFLHMHLFEFTGLELRATYLLAAVFTRNKIYFSYNLKKSHVKKIKLKGKLLFVYTFNRDKEIKSV